MVLDGALAAAGDEDHVGDARGDRLLHRVLDERLVDDRQHLLRRGLGRRQEARAEAGDGKDGLGDFVERSFFVEHLQELRFVEHRRRPARCALSSLLPASAPATTKSVFFDTDPRDLAARGLDPLLRFVARHAASVPVSTTILPAKGPGGRLRGRAFAFLPVHAGGAQLLDHLAVVRLARRSARSTRRRSAPRRAPPAAAPRPPPSARRASRSGARGPWP